VLIRKSSSSRLELLYYCSKEGVWSPSIGLHKHSSIRLLPSQPPCSSSSSSSRAEQHLARSKLRIYRRYDARRQPRHALPSDRTLEGMAKLAEQHFVQTIPYELKRQRETVGAHILRWSH
jgi:hypothetical protein